MARHTDLQQYGSELIRLKRQGFTLLEVLLVVMIVAILARVVVVNLHSAARQADQELFVSQVRLFAEAARRYMTETGQYLEDSATGQCPAGFAAFIDEDLWTAPTPIGGRWDFELDSFGIKSGFGVHFYGNSGPHPGDAFMRQIDEKLDDGNLSAGHFRKIAPDRYYFVIEDD